MKELSLELLDITLHQGSKGLEYIKSTPVYKSTDTYLHYDQKFEAAKTNGLEALNFVNDKIYFPLRKNLIVIIDKSADLIIFLVKAAHQQEQKIVEYIRRHYENVCISVKDNWLRLDFN